MEVFNDYLEFKILPWHKWGQDHGKFYPVRKTAIRLLKNERTKQKWEEYERNQGITAEQEKEQKGELGFALRKESKKELSRTASSKGFTVKELVTNTAEFPVPDYDEAVNWDEKESWKKYAAPLELDDYYNAHPEEKPADWVSPRSLLKTREEDEKEIKEQEERDRIRKLKAMGWEEPPTS